MKRNLEKMIKDNYFEFQSTFNSIMTQASHIPSLGFSKLALRHALIGAAVGFIAISIFVFGVENPDPAWPANWRFKPLLLTPVITAVGGLGVNFLHRWRAAGSWMSAVGYVLSIVGFVFSLWIGIVLGLDGTMWN